ncbi:MAG: hypothetical protein AB7L13_00635 [Acidimicrobiia bacterium]
MASYQLHYGRFEMPLFDTYVAVDWSASSTPKRGRDSIWIAFGDELHNPATRHEATALLRTALLDAVHRGVRTIVGWDFAFSYPAGTLSRLGFQSWHELFDMLAGDIVDRPDNSNNRFAVAAELNRRIGCSIGPLWGCPPSAAGRYLTTRRGPVTELGEYRACERLLRQRGRAVHSPFKLFTAGSVGSQTLVGLPRLHELRNDRELAPHSAVWPFESVTSKAVVHVEIWPPDFAVDYGSHDVRDAAQVLAVTTGLARLDRGDRLSSALSVPDLAVIAEEGWVLSAPD